MITKNGGAKQRSDRNSNTRTSKSSKNKTTTTNSNSFAIWVCPNISLKMQQLPGEHNDFRMVAGSTCCDIDSRFSEGLYMGERSPDDPGYR